MILRRRRFGVRRVLAWTTLVVIAALLAAIARPAAHLLRAAWRDSGVLEPVPAGFTHDASRLNRTAVSEMVHVAADPAEAERQLAELVRRAARDKQTIAIAGARHTMGGHTIYPGAIVLDMQPFNRIELDESGETLRVGAGARWDQIIPYLDQRGRSVEIMQSNNSFTVGGSISANCHGWQPNRPPIASTVRSFRLMKADGSIVGCSREENAELFSLVLGGYGLFGVILDAELQTIPNERYQMQRFVIEADQLAEVFAREVAGNPGVGMAYGRLCIAPGADEFLRQAVLNVFTASPCPASEMPPLAEPSLAALKRAVFRGSADSEYGKELRWEAELMLSDRLAQSYVSRNQLLNDPVELYQDRSAETTDILHEYFVPPEELAGFLERMREIIPRHDADLLNVTIRHVLAEHPQGTFLRYADRELFAVVLLFSQTRTPGRVAAGGAEAEAGMERLTQELIDAALDLGGRYYLPYRLHATPEQFERAYPQGKQFFELKRKYDPNELFKNQFYSKYE